MLDILTRIFVTNCPSQAGYSCLSSLQLSYRISTGFAPFCNKDFLQNKFFTNEKILNKS